MLSDNLRVKTGLSAFDQKVSLFFFSLISNLNLNFLDSLESLGASISVTLDDDLRMHTFINESFSLFQKLSSSEDDGGGSVTDFIVLRSSDIYKSFGSWMDNVKKTDQSGAIIGDGYAFTVMDKFIHASWSEGCFDNFDNRLAGIDVRNDLTSS